MWNISFLLLIIIEADGVRRSLLFVVKNENKKYFLKINTTKFLEKVRGYISNCNSHSEESLDNEVRSLLQP